MTIRTDVLVVGGGATGAGVARDLALRGLDVTLVDRAGLSSGTSSRSHGLLHSGARYAEADRAGAEECLEENRVLRDVAGACVRDTGGLFVQLSDDEPTYFEEKRAACEEIGIPVDVIDGDEARATVPGLSTDAVRAMRVPDGVIYPSRLVAANAADAREHGARILTHAPVEGMETGAKPGRGTGTRTGTEAEAKADGDRIVGVAVGGRIDDVVEPAYVVNAAGAWAGRIAALAGASVEMAPTRGAMVAVEYDGLEPVLNRCRPPDDGDIVVPHDREVVLGTTSVAVSDPDAYPREEWEVERTVAECAKLLPAVADAAERRRWWGVRPLPALGEDDRGARGISRDFVLLDHATDGVENLATIVGGKLTTYRAMAEAASDLVCERLAVDADPVTADRRLPGADDPDRLDEFVATFESRGPADEDVVGGARDG